MSEEIKVVTGANSNSRVLYARMVADRLLSDIDTSGPVEVYDLAMRLTKETGYTIVAAKRVILRALQHKRGEGVEYAKRGGAREGSGPKTEKNKVFY